MKDLRFIRPAEMELLDAARYYEMHAPGLGDDFLDKIDLAIRDLREHPEGWPIVRFSIRRRLIQRFPYALLYRVDPDEIIVLATMHLRRHPDYWLDRV
jgi:toxin ParE1/3/4